MFIKKKYGIILVGTPFLIIIFTLVGLVVYGLTSNLWSENSPMLSKIGIGTSIIGVFLGTFIAIWLINRDKVKNIEEQHVYKVAVLHDLSTMIISVQQALYHAKNFWTSTEQT